MKKSKIIILLSIVTSLILVTTISGIIYYNHSLKSVSTLSNEVNFIIEKGQSTNIIISNLKSANLVKNELTTKIYSKFRNDFIPKPGNFILNRNMSVEEIFNILNKESDIVITFKEGKTVKEYIEVASTKLGLDYESSFELVNSKAYLEELISSEKYWFLTNSILNDKIYIGLEGYLFPDTYHFSSSMDINDVVIAMLDNMLTKINPLKEDITKSDLNIHEILTLASIVESEAKTAEDRLVVSGVFVNRINYGWPLGSDVTTYYGAHKTFGEELTIQELNDCSNGYNTRCNSFAGLSIGPISNPGITSIIAAVNPTKTDYMYFVADCSGKTYFNMDDAGHQSTIAKLSSEGNWCV